MATLSASGGTGQITLTGSGFTPGAKALISVAFTAAGRRYNELRQVEADGSGAVSVTVPVPHVGSVVVKAVDIAGVVQATTGSASVT